MITNVINPEIKLKVEFASVRVDIPYFENLRCIELNFLNCHDILHL